MPTFISIASYLYSITLFNTAWGLGNACKAEYDDKYYDLSALIGKSDYVITSEHGRIFTLNVCRSVVAELWNMKDVEGDVVGGFFRGEHGDVNIGRFNTTLILNHGHPLLVYEEGSLCPGTTNLRASTVIRFICDPIVFSKGIPRLIAQLPADDSKSCAYVFEWRTYAACPITRPNGAGGQIAAFASILFVALLVYVTGAITYNRYWLGLRGFAQLPAFSILPNLDNIHIFRERFYQVWARFEGSNSSSELERRRWGGGTYMNSEVDEDHSIDSPGGLFVADSGGDDQFLSYNHQPLPPMFSHDSSRFSDQSSQLDDNGVRLP